MFKKNIDLNVFDDVWKNQNIMLTMHISDVFQMIEKLPEIFKSFSTANYRIKLKFE